MSADLLRRAAALMRERAEAVPDPDGEDGTVLWREDWFNWKRMCREDAAYIASWHPAVALAVADWLDDEATNWQRIFEATQQRSRGVDEPPAVNFGDPEAAAANADHHARHALDVARTYLGESA